MFSHSIPWEITKTRRGKEYYVSICAGGFDLPCCLLRSDSTGQWWASKYSQTWPYDVTQVSAIFLKVDHTKSCLFLKASWFREGWRINIRLESCSTCCHCLSMNSLAIESLAFPKRGCWFGTLWDVSVGSSKSTPLPKYYENIVVKIINFGFVQGCGRGSAP